MKEYDVIFRFNEDHVYADIESDNPEDAIRLVLDKWKNQDDDGETLSMSLNEIIVAPKNGSNICYNAEEILAKFY